MSNAAYTLLGQRDTVMRRLIRSFGRPDPFRWMVSTGQDDDRFAALVLHILSQQISTVSARHMFGGLDAALNKTMTPEAVLNAGEVVLLRCGLSHAKAASVLDVSTRIVDGSLDLERLDRLSDGDVVAALTAARGIGPWTAQMFLIHQLCRPDVFPSGDLGIRHALQQALTWDVLPAIADADQVAKRWAPFRTYAAALLWASLRPGAGS